MDFLEACRKLIGIDSTSSNGNKEAAAFVGELCRSKGLHVTYVEDFIGDKPQMNVIVRTDDQRPPNEFLLQSHLDTVEPGPFALWSQNSSNPFDATIIDGKIYGLGAAEVKLDFLCKLEALCEFKNKSRWKLPPVLIGTYGEEQGMLGALKLIRKNQVSARMGLIGEPTDLKLVNAAKGVATVEIQIPFNEDELNYRKAHDFADSTSSHSKFFTGKASHSSSPYLGESAIKKMLDYIKSESKDFVIMNIDGGTNYNTVPSHAHIELDSVKLNGKSINSKITEIYNAILQLEEEFQSYTDPAFHPSYPTLNIGTIRTNDEFIQILGNCRIPPVIRQDTYEKWMNGLKNICQKNESRFQITDYKKPFRTEDNTILIKGCLDELRSMGLYDKCISQPSTNEASIFSRVGVECACFGPGKREGNAHTPSEHVDLKDLSQATEFYKRAIERFCI